MPCTSKELDEYLDEFIVELHNYCRTEKNIAERTRSLDYARSELLVAELRIGESNPTTWVLKIVRSAVYFIECEMRIITMELDTRSASSHFQMAADHWLVGMGRLPSCSNIPSRFKLRDGCRRTPVSR